MNLPLSPQDYQTIRLAYKKAKDTRTATYLNIILLKHKNYKQVEIADILNIDENTVCTWIKKFEICTTLSDYLTLNYSTYTGKLSYTFLGKIDNFVENTSFPDAKPIISQIQSRFKVTYSVSGITKLLKRLSFSYKEKVALPSKLNIEKQEEFVKKYNLIQSNLTDTSAMFFMDAVHPQHNTHTLKAWLRKGKPSYILTNSGRNRLNINGLYNPHNQDVLVTYHKTINAQATIELFEKLKRQYPFHENLYVFADNAKYYVSKVLKAYLAHNPIIKLIHLPTYSPNLNLIERLWKYTRKVVINPHYHEKFESFSNSIKFFFDNIDQHKESLAQFIGQKFRLFDLDLYPKTNFR
jgi:transposase